VCVCVCVSACVCVLEIEHISQSVMIDRFKLLLERVGDAVVPLRNCSDTVVCCQVLSWQYFLH